MKPPAQAKQSDRPRLTTARLTLRHMCPDDYAAIFEIVSRFEVVKNLAKWPHPADPSMVDGIIAGHQAEPSGGFGIEHEGRLIGMIGTGQSSDGGVDSQSIGFMLHPDYWGRGLMPEALMAVQDYSLDALGFEAVKGHVFTHNAASARVFEKCGWREVEGCDSYCEALQKPMRDRVFVMTRRFDWMDPIETARLVIRPIGARDFDALWPLLNDFEIVRMLFSWPWPADKDFTMSRLESATARAGLFSAITLDGTTIGFVGCLHGSLFYALGRAHWGKGYAREAAAGKIARAFADPKVKALTAGTWDDNLASSYILKSLGFVETGRDTVFHPARGEDTSGPDFELTRANWAAFCATSPQGAASSH